MIEIIDIYLLLIIFLLFVSGPISIYGLNFGNLKIEGKLNLYFNLLINLNVLLYLSILPLKLSEYIYIIYALLIFLLIKNYLLNLRKINLKSSFSYLLIFFVVFFILAIDISNKLNLSWDSKWFWFIKSLYFFQDNTYKQLSDYTYNDFHPHFGSYLWAFFRKISLNQYEYFGRLFYLFIYLGSLMLVSISFFKKNIYNSIIFILLIILNYKYYYFSGLQEIILFSFLIIISKLVFEYINNRNILYLIFIALTLNLILWTKSEGIAFFFITLICINFIKKIDINHRIKFNLIMMFFLILKITIFKIFDIKLNNQPYYLDYILSLNFDLIIFKILNISAYLFYYSLTNIIFIIFPLIILFKLKKIFNNEFDKFNFTFYILNILFIFSAYLFRDMEIIYSLKTTIDRIVFASSGFYLLYIINYLKSLSFKN